MKHDMNSIKIVFFDIDGTVIDLNTKKISNKMLQTLVQLKEKNIILCIATGRPPMSLPRFEEVEFDTFLTFNGSYCFNKDHLIFSNPIPTADVKKIIHNAASINRPVSIATTKRLAANGRDQDLIDYYAFTKQEVEIAEDFEEVVNEEIYQVMLGCREEEYAQIMKDVLNAKITAWWDRAVDIIPANGGKGRGVEKILEYYHLTKEEAMAFGDGNNDIEMLKAVGLGVAMGNASAELKEIADDLCGHVAADGIYEYCKEHGFI